MIKPITNCHTHIFTGDHVPPYLGRTLMPWPLYRIVNIRWLIAIVRSASNRTGWLRTVYFQIKKPVDGFVFWWQGLTQHNKVWKMFAWLVNTAIAAVCFIFLASFLLRFFQKGFVYNIINCILNLPYCKQLASTPTVLKIIVLVLGYIFVIWVRRIVKLLLFAACAFIKNIAGSASIQLLKRYYNIAKLSKDKDQLYVFTVLKNSYPDGSRFVVLPMDLDYAGAGNAKKNYLQQLDELILLKKNPAHTNELKPFVFADPRRIEAQPEYYQTIINCLEKEKFSGIKIYPALGYYPFDKNLLELFLYACKNEIPIMTHSIKGVIFYRGIKKREWDRHPIFTEKVKQQESNMKLPQFKNIDFINNFTHPLNYICLLDPVFLKMVLFALDPGTALTDRLYSLYGFTKNDIAGTSVLTNNLQNLKLCFGHFGGEDEWANYIEKDLDSSDNKFMRDPLHSQKFLNPLAPVWKSETWYSIIRSIIMNKNYPNVYADISFILYDTKIFPLLKSSLQVPKLQDRILYGTDFYVVRQKGTDKKFWIDLQSELSPEEIDRITIDNPSTFIK